MAKEFKQIEKLGFVFSVEVCKNGKPGKFEKDLFTAAEILEKAPEEMYEYQFRPWSEWR